MEQIWFFTHGTFMWILAYSLMIANFMEVIAAVMVEVLHSLVVFDQWAASGQPLKQVENYKYLGVLLNSSLSWSTHIHNIWSRARHTGDYILFRTFATHSSSSSLLQLYVLVHPHLEYACAMLRETLNLLEGAQKFGLRVCFKQYSSSYEDLLLIYCKSTSVKVMNVS